VPAARSIPLLLVSLLAAAILAGCGGGGGSSDEDQVNDAVNKAFTSNDPSICTDVATQNFIKTFYGGSLDQCKKDAENGSDNPDSLDVTGIKIDGDTATVAKITAHGGPNDGEVVTATLKKEGGTWKFDSATPVTTGTTGTTTGATGTTATDPAAELFFKTVHTTVIKKGLSEQVAQCIEENLRGTITPEEIDQIKAGKRPPSLRTKATQAGAQCGAKFGG
jgi:hypothetical protein